jgi:predicted DCC family thiol-disulfide oxidoreductase YuxK
MRRLHAVLPTGEVISGVEVIRSMYRVVGLGWIFHFTKLPVIGPFVDAVYNRWAHYRTQLTRGNSLEQLLKEHEERSRTSCANNYKFIK